MLISCLTTKCSLPLKSFLEMYQACLQSSPVWCMLATAQLVLCLPHVPLLLSLAGGGWGRSGGVESGLSESQGWLYHSCQGSCPLLQVRKQKVITLPTHDIMKDCLWFFVIIKRRYFPSLGFNRFSKRSQHWFHHCTLPEANISEKFPLVLC